ncbi:lactonase family protein [Formosa sp. 4Alg 33]|uniref:lactonase family protein n=1 Tax=Formosa sp. 4Alg 33 TaxID=3382189 RepID=UPI003D9C56DC
MKIVIFILSFIFITSCNTNKSATKPDSSQFYVGTYTTKDSKGIYKYELNSDGTFKSLGLKAVTENPSFITFSSNKENLIVANEIDVENSGAITSFSIENDTLIFKNTISSGGTNPCYVATNSDDYIITANYSSGTVGLHSIKEDGSLSDLLATQKHTGKGTTSRQESPHAHSAWFEPNSNTIISIDLGTNQLWFSKIDTISNTLQPIEPLVLDMAEGAGPRHLAFHPNSKWIYVLNELDNTVTRIEKSSNRAYTIEESISTLPSNYKKENTSADIHMSNDGLFLYTSNRGHNSIAIYKVNKTNGTLTFIAHESTHGKDPRNFSLSPSNDYIVVANQTSDNLVSFKRDKKTGALQYVDEINAPTPVCVLFE